MFLVVVLMVVVEEEGGECVQRVGWKSGGGPRGGVREMGLGWRSKGTGQGESGLGGRWRCPAGQPGYVGREGGGGAKGELVRSGIRTHASRGDCDLNAAP